MSPRIEEYRDCVLTGLWHDQTGAGVYEISVRVRVFDRPNQSWTDVDLKSIFELMGEAYGEWERLDKLFKSHEPVVVEFDRETERLVRCESNSEY